MNDYAGTDHRVIYEMVRAGKFGQVNGCAAKLNGIRNRLGGHILGLREQLAGLSAVWSDDAGSERMTTDLDAVTGYLDLLAAGLSGQPSSYSDLVAQGAADLAAAQPPAVLPPPPLPGHDVGSLKAQKQQSLVAASLNPVLEPVVLQNIQATYDVRIDQAAAAQQLAGQTASTLDGQYRTLLARLTPPPEPPALVSAAGATTGLAPAVGGELVGGGSVGDAAWQRASASSSGWSSAGAAAGAGSAGGSVAVPIAPAAGSAVTTGAGWTTPVAAAGGFGGEVGTGGTGGVQGSPGAVSGQGVVGVDWPHAAKPSSGLRSDPAALTSEWDATANAARSAHLAPGSAAVGHPVLPGGLEFNPVTGAPVIAGAGQFGVVDRPGVSPWEVAGVGGLAALAGGALYLARGGAGAGGVGVTSVVGSGSGGVVGPAGYGATGSVGSGSVGNGTVSNGALGNGAVGNGSGAGGPTSTGAANNAATAGRGLLPGSGGLNSMVQSGQIGQSGRLGTGSAGYGIGRPVAPGSSIGGGQQDSRVTWLVEDRDLYGIGPSVAAVIEVPIEPS